MQVTLLPLEHYLLKTSLDPLYLIENKTKITCLHNYYYFALVNFVYVYIYMYIC
jgi:hypothetical protein